MHSLPNLKIYKAGLTEVSTTKANILIAIAATVYED